MKPPLEWQSAQISCVCIDCAWVRLPNEPLPKLVTWPIALGESWQAVQLADLGETTIHCIGSVTPEGFEITAPNGLESTLYELFTWQALQLMPTPGQATSAA